MRKLPIVLYLLISLIAFSYPSVVHRPVILSEDGWVVLDLELENPSSVKLTVRLDSDSFTLISPTTTHHRITVPVAEPFDFVLRSGSEILREGRIDHMPVSEKNEFSFVVYGDSRWGKEVHERIIEMANDLKIPYLFNLGDLVSSDLNDGDWKDFFDVIDAYKGIIFTAKGNHDLGMRYGMYLYPNSYTVKIGKIRFVVMDSNSPFLGSELRSALEDFKDENSFKVVMFHHVVFSCGPHGDDLDTILRRGIHEILRDHGVKLVFTSHDHNYQRLEKDGVTYIVTGGGGAGLYNVNPEEDCGAELIKWCKCYHMVLVRVSSGELHVRVLSTSGKEIDGFRVEMERGE